MGSAGSATAKYVTFKCKCQLTYAPCFAWQFTVSTSRE
jgi:hypothetical protein